MRVKKAQWQFLAGKLSERLFELANIAGGAMIFGQFISEKPFSIWILSGGIVIVISLYLVSGYILLSSRR